MSTLFIPAKQSTVQDINYDLAKTVLLLAIGCGIAVQFMRPMIPLLSVCIAGFFAIYTYIQEARRRDFTSKATQMGEVDTALRHSGPYRGATAFNQKEFSDSVVLRFNWRRWALAGSGFFIGSYNLLAINNLIPIPAFTFEINDMYGGHSMKLNAVPLFGSVFGQLVFGYLVDIFDRRIVFSYEVSFFAIGIAGLWRSIFDDEKSTSILAWLAVYQFCIGVSIGAEFSISAVITSEYTSRLGELIAHFWMPMLGELAASSVFLAVLETHGHRRGLTNEANPVMVSLAIKECWGMVLAIGAIPALIAIILRSSIPESPRHALDVQEPHPKLRTAEGHEKLSCVTIAPIVDGKTNRLRPEEFSFKKLKNFFWLNGNWRYVAVAAFCTFLLDVATPGIETEPSFFTRILSKTLTAKSTYWTESPLEFLAYESVKTGIIIFLFNHLAAMVPGSTRLYSTRLALVIALSGPILINTIVTPQLRAVLLILLFSNIGSKTFVYKMVAEACPTYYRGTCYGISIASGKLGSIGLRYAVTYTDIKNSIFFGTAMVCIIALGLAYYALSFNVSGRILESLGLINGKIQRQKKPVPLGPPRNSARKEVANLISVVTHAIRRSRVSLSPFFWPRVEGGYTRLQWRCDCGVHLFGDFWISSDREKYRLMRFLNGLSEESNPEPPIPDYSPLVRMRPSGSASHTPSNSGRIASQSSDGSPSGSMQMSSMAPRNSSDGLQTSHTISGHQIPGSGGGNVVMNKYIALCVNTGRCHTTLGEINVSSVSRDNEVFRMIKQRYLEIRGYRAHARRLFLLRPNSTHFIRVEDSHRADIIEVPSFPPVKEVLERRYDYAPLDLPLPPITSNSFIHYMEFPECESLQRTRKWLTCLPKRLGDQLGQQRLARDPDDEVAGWAIHIDEGLNEEIAALICMIVLLISGIVGVSYASVMKDPSAGFAIAGWIVAVASTGMTMLYFRWKRV